MIDVHTVRSRLEAQMPFALEMLRRMVEINSFTGNPEGVNKLSRLTGECFAPLGFGAEFVPSTNPEYGAHLVMQRRGMGEQALSMVSHLDTVFSPEEELRNNFHWQVEGDRIYGPGTQDIKGGTVMMWLVLDALRHCAPELFERCTWQLFLNSSEERFSPDFGDLCRARFVPGTRAALVFEAEGREQDNIPRAVVARKGRATWRISVSGRASHAGGKHPHGANAVVQLAETVRQVHAMTDYDQQLTFTVATIQGGTVLNRVPHEATAEGEFRAFSPRVYRAAKEALLALAGPGTVCSADGYPCQVHVQILSESRPWPRNERTDELFACWASAAAQLGLPLGMQERGGLSDGNLIWDAVPTLDGLGPWGDNDHCSERAPDGSKLPEYVEISSFVPKALLNCVAIANLLKQR